MPSIRPDLVGPQRTERDWALAPAMAHLAEMLRMTTLTGLKPRSLLSLYGPTKVGP